MELGSEFNLRFYEQPAYDNFTEYIKEFNSLYTDGGRSALRILIYIYNFKSVLLPDFICESVIDCFADKQKSFYKINTDMSIDMDSLEELIKEKHADCLYLMHYFGKLQDKVSLERIVELKRKYGFTIIEDTTHSILTKAYTIGDFCVCSLRKWFPIPDGGVLYSKQKFKAARLSGSHIERIAKRLYAMELKTLYLRGFGDYNAEYRKLFSECEGALDEDFKNREISKASEGILTGLSIYEEQNKRLNNLKYIKKHVTNELIEFVIKDDNIVPLAVPIYIRNRDKLREYLINHNIFCAVHWPIVFNSGNRKQAEKISEMILSLPVDSRYDMKDLCYMCEILNAYREE